MSSKIQNNHLKNKFSESLNTVFMLYLKKENKVTKLNVTKEIKQE